MNKLTKKINKIGIPRSMSYYQNYPFYYGFFEKLGISVVVSDKTTSKIINDGTKYVVSETCLPVKVFVGHVVNLLDKGISDIFIPSLQSVDYKINNCSKIRGLPEILRNVIDKPLNIIEPVLDKTNNIGFYDFWYSLIRYAIGALPLLYYSWLALLLMPFQYFIYLRCHKLFYHFPNLYQNKTLEGLTLNEPKNLAEVIHGALFGLIVGLL